jgi:dTMP kinase
MKKGLFIVFEGTDGTGKSTQLTLLANYLTDHGFSPLVTREPTTGKYGQKIRELYSNRAEHSPEEELELFLLDRQEHVDIELNPALESGRIVLCDRYFLSTVAYQGALGFDTEVLLEKNSFAPAPDIALLLHAPLETGQSRITGTRGDVLNDFEQVDYLTEVAKIFSAMTMDYITPIMASGTIDEVHTRVLKAVTPLLKNV